MEIQRNWAEDELRVVERRKRSKRRRRVRRARMIAISLVLILMFAFVFGIVWVVNFLQERAEKKAVLGRSIQSEQEKTEVETDNSEWKDFYALELPRPPLQVELLTPNEYSRPGEALPDVKNIFVHYTANAGTSATQNRSYFESLKDTKERSASAHFVIGIEGEIVQCIPTSEIAYAVMKRNYDSLSIECCYLNENGVFTKETYDTLIQMTAWLLHKYKLRPEDVLRHYDEGGKNCPKYYVENEQEWNKFIKDLKAYMKSCIA